MHSPLCTFNPYQRRRKRIIIVWNVELQRSGRAEVCWF